MLEASVVPDPPAVSSASSQMIVAVENTDSKILTTVVARSTSDRTIKRVLPIFYNAGPKLKLPFLCSPAEKRPKQIPFGQLFVFGSVSCYRFVTHSALMADIRQF